jgi:2-enoate reductase
MVGCETGHYLAERGKKVVIIEILPRMAADMSPMARRRLLDGLRAKQAIMLAGATCEAIREGSVIVTTAEGQTDTVQADTVILAVGYRANDDLVKTLEGKVPEVCCIGDSSQPRAITEAINDGYRTGLSL